MTHVTPMTALLRPPCRRKDKRRCSALGDNRSGPVWDGEGAFYRSPRTVQRARRFASQSVVSDR